MFQWGSKRKAAVEVIVNVKEEILTTGEMTATRATAVQTIALMAAVMVQMEMTQVKTEEGHRVVLIPAPTKVTPAPGIERVEAI